MNAGIVRTLIVNADDFGQSESINEGIVEAVEQGIVTSTSAMVRWDAFPTAADWARGHPELTVGLHVDFGEWILDDGQWAPLYEVVDTDDETAVRDELERQLDRFDRVMGRPPSHLDSHQHVHLREPVRSAVLSAGRRLGAHVRSQSKVLYCGEFYGQWNGSTPHHESISVAALERLIAGLQPGTTELACHPGADELTDVTTMYADERAIERRTLCDARIRRAIVDQGVILRGFGPGDAAEA